MLGTLISGQLLILVQQRYVITFCFTILITILSSIDLSATIYYTRANGDWDNGNTWSLIDFGGPAAGSFPVAGDTAYHQKHRIEVVNADAACAYLKILGSGNGVAKMEVYDGFTLAVSGDVLMDINGGNFESHLHLKEFTPGLGSGLMTVAGNLLMYKASSNDLVYIELENDAVLTINGNMYMDYDGGSNEILVVMMSVSELHVLGNLTLDYGAGTGKVHFNLEDDATLDVDGNITFTSTAQAKTEIDMLSGTTLKLGGNFIRTAAPNDYGFVDTEPGSTIIYDGSATQSVAQDTGAGTDGITYQNLTINNTYGISNQLSLEGDVTVNQILTLTDGVVKLDTSDLTIANDGTISGGSINSYLNATLTNGGKLIKNLNSTGSINLAVGDYDEYSPFTFTLNSATFGGNDLISIMVADSTHPSLSPGDIISRFWRLDASGFTAMSYDVSYIYMDADVIGTEASLITSRYNGVAWFPYELTNPATNTLTSLGGITSIPSNHDFSAGNAIALPIELLIFTGKLINEQVLLEWITSVEINNHYFSVERSWRGTGWEHLGIINSVGQSVSETKYQFTDADPYVGTSYYRLKQTDEDGKFDYSETIAIHRNQAPDFSSIIYPNPISAGQKLHLTLSGVKAGQEILVLLYNLSGKQVFSEVLIINADMTIQLSDNLPNGVYHMVEALESMILKQKVVITGRN